MAYWDIGPPDAKETLLLTHGEPSWSFLYRRMIDPLLSKGYRVVLFDQVGFGWSDKPSEETDYTYERHVAWNEDLVGVLYICLCYFCCIFICTAIFHSHLI
mmetsp:Transcript_1396/g.2149  ORF Transcript_1396/g.2149 Transcript_1396/m.2149 type:complete len:101 (+) Transcript_1396:178-480(+)